MTRDRRTGSEVLALIAAVFFSGASAEEKRKCGEAGTTCSLSNACSTAEAVLKGQKGFCNAGGCTYEATGGIPSADEWCCYANCDGTGQPKAGKRRRLDIVNQCQRPMIITANGGNSEVACASDGTCQEGMTCNPATNQCYFDFEEPQEGWTIAANASVVLWTPNAAVLQGNGVLADWSGKLEFHANHTLDGGEFPSAICNGRPHCPTYQGMNGISTAVEFTFVPFGSDFYDVSVINGMNIPIEMRPNDLFNHVTEEASGSQRGYNCGAAGAAAQPDSRLSACSWSYNLSTQNHLDLGPLLNQVDGGFGPCTSDADCIDGLVCGQVATVVPGSTAGIWRPTTHISMECGKRIGLWSVYQLCVWSGNTYQSPPPFEGVIDCPASHNMFACAGSEPWTTTCYSSPGECCGCVNWSEILGRPIPEGGKGCQGSSNLWLQKGLPYYSILKNGCPTSYTYAFDDETSTFTCQSAESRADPLVPNEAGYIITLCAGTNAAPPAPPAPPGPSFVDVGEGRACRGATSRDNSASYYHLFTGILSLDNCKSRCVGLPDCVGVEFNQVIRRCEVWTRPEGIGAFAKARGYRCLRYLSETESTTSPPGFSDADGRLDRACRGVNSGDNSLAYYKLFTGILSLDSCKALCTSMQGCVGVEFQLKGRCEVWTRPQGIGATAKVPGYQCLRYDPSMAGTTTSTTIIPGFSTVDGGENRACRGATSTDNSHSYYNILSNVLTLEACKSECVGVPGCVGIEFNSNGRCEVWTRTLGIKATAPAFGYQCLRYVQPAARENLVQSSKASRKVSRKHKFLAPDSVGSSFIQASSTVARNDALNGLDQCLQ